MPKVKIQNLINSSDNSWEEYYIIHERKVAIGSYQLSYMTKLGIPEPHPGSQLLATYLGDEPAILHADKLLVLGDGNGLYTSYLASKAPQCQIWVTDLTSTSITLLHRAVQANHLPNIRIFPDMSTPELGISDIDTKEFDIAVIILPKGRKVFRRWLLQAYQALKEKGVIYILGANNQGVLSAADDTKQLFTEVHTLAYKKSNRIFRAIKSDSHTTLPEWANQPGIAPQTWCEYTTNLLGHKFIIRTLPGVFSYEHLDDGSRMLLESMEIPKGRVLDIGCGCGILGIAAAFLGATEVHLADNHIFSIASTYENLSQNFIQNAQVFASDLYDGLPDSLYHLILSNPPFHSGREVDYQIAKVLITQGYARLHRGGAFTIVANRFIPYNRLMENIFHNVKVLKSDSKFHVLMSLKI